MVRAIEYYGGMVRIYKSDRSNSINLYFNHLSIEALTKPLPVQPFSVVSIVLLESLNSII
jgi:hypothetical protein